MSKVVGMLVALAMFCAMPAVAFAQGGSGDDNVSSGNTQNGEINQGAAGGSADGGDAAGGDGSGGDGGIGGDAGNQACLIQQNAGRDANAECNQEQNFGGDTFVTEGGVGGGDVEDDNDVEVEDDDVSGNFGVGGGDVGGGDVGGGSVQSVTLARTGFDAWVLALIGGLSLAGGMGLLAAQRRGRLSA